MAKLLYMYVLFAMLFQYEIILIVFARIHDIKILGFVQYLFILVPVDI